MRKWEKSSIHATSVSILDIILIPVNLLCGRKRKVKSTDSVIVSWDFSRGKDAGILIVGSQKNGRVDIINAYQGKEAYELYRKLTVKKKGANN